MNAWPHQTYGIDATWDAIAAGRKASVGAAKDTAIRLTDLYASRAAPTIMPALVESEFTIGLPGEIELAGRLDVATVDGRVLDLKTRGRSMNQRDADSSVQLTMYAVGYRALAGKPPSGVGLEVLVDTSTPKHQRLVSSRSEGDIAALVARINALAKARSSGAFLPVEAGHWLCGPKYCGYWTSCPFVNSQRAAAADANERS